MMDFRKLGERNKKTEKQNKLKWTIAYKIVEIRIFSAYWGGMVKLKHDYDLASCFFFFWKWCNKFWLSQFDIDVQFHAIFEYYYYYYCFRFLEHRIISCLLRIIVNILCIAEFSPIFIQFINLSHHIRLRRRKRNKELLSHNLRRRRIIFQPRTDKFTYFH